MASGFLRTELPSLPSLGLPQHPGQCCAPSEHVCHGGSWDGPVAPEHMTLERCAAHLGLVQCLSLSLALQGNVLILGTDLVNNTVQVQVTVVVHGQDDRHVTDVGLDLRNLLRGNQGWSQDVTDGGRQPPS